MDILLIVLSIMGLSFLTIGTGAVVKDAASKLNNGLETQPNPKAVLNIRKFLRILGIFLLVYVCLNIVTLLVILLTGQEETLNSLRKTLIECNLLISLPITWIIVRKK